MKNLFGKTSAEIFEILNLSSREKFRAKQIAQWIYEKMTDDFDAMTNLPKSFRENLKQNAKIFYGDCVTRWISQDALTEKFLLRLEDDQLVETVLMRHNYGNSVCLSTQVGCAMHCAFCASTLKGLIRNLTMEEMLAQLYFHKKNCKIDTMVLMGSGEPLANYQNVVRFLKFIHEPEIFNFSYRNITLSTSGLCEKIYDLAKENLPISLAISLHAPNDDIRKQLMPIAKKYSMQDVLNAGKFYADTTKRRVTYEYILIKNLNDQPIHAKELAQRLKGQLASVNLIPINPVKEKNFLRPSLETIQNFQKILEQEKIAVTIRKEMGSDIRAACGQLRNQFTQ